jgi:hypothetical protein
VIMSIRRRFRPSVEALDARALCDAGMPADADAGAFAAQDVPPEIVAATDPTGYIAGVAGSSWTGDAGYDPGAPTPAGATGAFD